MKSISRTSGVLMELKYDFQNLYKRAIVIFLFFITLSYLRTDYLLKEFHGKSVELSILDGISTLLGEFLVPLVLAPLFIFAVLEVISPDANPLYTTRYFNRSTIWRKKLIKTIIFSFLFTTSLVLIEIVIGSYFLSYSNSWTSTDGVIYKIASVAAQQNDPILLQNWENYISWYNPISVIGTMIIFNVAGFTAVSLLVHIIIMLLDKPVYGYVFLLLIVTTDTFIEGYSLVFDQMIINYNEWLSIKTLLWQMSYLIGLVIVFYMVGNIVIQRKDYLFSKNTEYVGEDYH